MNAVRSVWLAVTALLLTGALGVASAQTQLGGMNLEGEIEAGGRYFIQKPSMKERQKFEEYRDIPDGPFLQTLQLRLFRPDESYSVEAFGTKWGQQDQTFSFNVGRIGKWEFGFEWDQTPHIFSTDARMRAIETRRGVFTLPTARPPLATYNDAPPLHEIGVRWDKGHVSYKFHLTPDLELVAEYTRTHKDGDRPMGMAFSSPGGNFMEVLQPIEHTIHDFRLRGSYATPLWQLQVGYVFSAFENELNKVIADNPCFGTPAGCGAGDGPANARGQTSLPPNNMAHTLNLAGGVNLPLRTRINGNLAYSVRLQSDAFLPHTVNPALAGNPDLALPKPTLDGNVQTALVNLSATTRPFDLVTFGAKYRYYEFDDWSRTLTFPDGVLNDNALTGRSRSAGRWSYKRHNADLDARWRLIEPFVVTTGIGWEEWDRNEHREVPKSDEFFAKAAVDVTPAEWLLARLTYTPSIRRISNYNTHAHAEHNVVEDAAAALAGQSVLLRKFDEAERDRQKLELQLMFTPVETLSATHTVGWRYDDYVSSPLGLQQETGWSTGLDLSWTPVQRLSFSAGYTYEQMFQKMRSRSRPVTGTTTFDFADYDWISDLDDTVHTIYTNVRASLIPKVLDFSLGGNYSNALGRIDTRNPNAVVSGTAAQIASARAQRLPAFEDTLLRLDTKLSYHFLKNWTASLAYVFESFEKTDWRTDTLNPFIPGVSSIWLGNDAKNFSAHIVGLTLGYRFK